MCRFALHRQGQSSHVTARWHAMVCRGPRTFWTHDRARTTRLGYRPTGSTLAPSTDTRKGFRPARGDRVPTVGETR